jgi:ABC-2 type transport system ATP-binding protein
VSAAIAVRDLSRRHGAVQAAMRISFTVAVGEIFGLLGPNGAGKTTVVDCILGLTAPDEGRIEICGLDARTQDLAARGLIGAMLQATGLQDKITPREALDAFAAFYPAPLKTDVLLDRFGLREKQKAAYETLSGGQKQRLALALAFVGDPRVLVLDEPTTGLDPQMRRDLHGLIRAIKDDGRAVLLTTHDMAEAETLCDRIAVMAEGCIVVTGSPQELIAGSGATLEEAILKLTGRR